MANEGNQEYHGEYDENDDSYTSSRKRYYNSISDKRSSSRERSKKRSRRDRSYSSSRSKSPDYKRTRYHGTRENPNKSRVLGVFGLNSRTTEDDLADVFTRYGPIQSIRIVYDAKSHNSRGFGFIYYYYIDDATDARRDCNGMQLNGKRIRVDYSITKRPHTPTPGVYMGTRQSRSDDRHSRRRSRSSKRHHSRRAGHRSRSRSYSR